MVRVSGLVLLLAACGDNAARAPDPHCADWHQWGNNAQHTGASCATGQPLEHVLADVVFDPLVPDEVAAADGDLIVHYQAPLVDGDRVFMLRKGGTFTPCVEDMDPTMHCRHPEDLYRFASQTWSEVGYRWEAGALVEQWTYESSWKPPPGREVVFQPVIAGSRLAVPIASGGVAFLDETGHVVRETRPFGHDANTYVIGALAAFGDSVFYNAAAFDHDDPNGRAEVATLVEIDGDGRVRTARYDELVPDAPTKCYGAYDPVATPPPWPVIVDGVVQKPPLVDCGPQVPGMNQAVALASDGTLYVATHAQGVARYSYVLSINPGVFDVNWAVSLRDRLADGCFVTTGCADGAPTGVEPQTGMAPAPEVTDDSTSSPVVLPDGRVLYGSWSFYNGDRGHLFELSRAGKIEGTYDFGWDLTPAVAVIDGATRIAVKDNHYGFNGPGGPFDLTMLNEGFAWQWQFRSTNTQSCARQPDGSVTCTDDHPTGFEWCINAPAIDAAGTLYANSEDGNLYAVGKDGQLRGNLLLDTALGAAYTPVVLDREGRVYALNAGHLYVVGGSP